MAFIRAIAPTISLLIALAVIGAAAYMEAAPAVRTAVAAFSRLFGGQ